MEFRDRATFLNMAGLVQGGIVLLALGLAWVADLAPLQAIHWNLTDVLWSIAAIVPMLLLFSLATGLRQLVVDHLGPPLAECRWYDLLLLAALAGLGEELLFRGVLEPWIGRVHPLAGVVAANLLFGLMHAITPAYAVAAGAFGFYLSWLSAAPGDANLLRPILAHGLYDYVAFLLVIREYRRTAVHSASAREQSTE